MKHKYTKDDLFLAIQNSTSIAQVLKKLNLVPHGGNYRTIKNRIINLGLDISHFTGQAHSKGKTIGHKRPIEDYLSNAKPIQSTALRLRLIKEGLLQAKCYSCNLTIWLNQLIPLELEHKDGNHENNHLDNLTLLCPNCHALTPTYRSKNRKFKKLSSVLPF